MTLRSTPPNLGIGIVLAALALPLLGAAVAGRELHAFFQFPPPVDVPTDYLAWSWWAAAAVLLCVGGVLAPWCKRPAHALPVGAPASQPPAAARRFPGWGVAAVAWTLLWWFFAWTRLPWFEPLQRFTFFPLWLGFIVAINAAVEHRTGACLMRRAPGRWLALFVASAACWWAFEWLNRFVRNWHYLGSEEFGPVLYAIYGSLCFSTVLPAVAGVAEWLDSHPGWRARTAAGPRWSWFAHRAAAAVLLLGGTVGLVGAGALPTWFYPALWTAPLALLLAAPVFTGRRGLAHEVAAGDWSRAATWMLAALLCGFFWELWNWQSHPKWIYTVPGVDRWHVFEMPLLGYAGYLPFGLECLLVAESVLGRARASAHRGAASAPPA